MALQGAIVSVATSATLLSAGVGGRDGQTLLIQNPSTTITVYLGGSDVSSSVYGHALAPATATVPSFVSIKLDNGDALYGAVASGTQNLNVIRQGV